MFFCYEIKNYFILIKFSSTLLNFKNNRKRYPFLFKFVSPIKYGCLRSIRNIADKYLYDKGNTDCQLSNDSRSPM